MERTKHRLNCFCIRKPLLAMYGLDSRGRLYVHVKVFKQQRVFADLIAFGGEVAINCRECFRWHTIVFKSSSGKAELRETEVPPEVEEEKLDDCANVGGN